MSQCRQMQRQGHRLVHKIHRVATCNIGVLLIYYYRSLSCRGQMSIKDRRLSCRLVVQQQPCYRRENRAMPLYISIRMEFYNGIVCMVSLPQHAFLVGLCLQTAVNYLSKSDKY